MWNSTLLSSLIMYLNDLSVNHLYILWAGPCGAMTWMMHVPSPSAEGPRGSMYCCLASLLNRGTAGQYTTKTSEQACIQYQSLSCQPCLLPFRWIQRHFLEMSETGDTSASSEVELSVDWNTGVWTKMLHFTLGRWKTSEIQTLRVFKSKKVQIFYL